MAIEGLSVRPYLDHNASPRLAYDLRRYGYDVAFAREVGLERATDEEHLRWAAEQGRTLVTFDLDDFPVLATEWIEQRRRHAGIILVTPPQMPYRILLRRLLRFLETVSADDMLDRVLWLDSSWDPPE